MKHNKLLIEENELKEKLQNEITKTKEQLEKYLSLSNILSKKNEKIIIMLFNLIKELNHLLTKIKII